MVDLLCLHLFGEPDNIPEIVEEVRKLRAPVIKSIGNAAYTRRLYDALRAAGLKAKVVHRFYWNNQWGKPEGFSQFSADTHTIPVLLDRWFSMFDLEPLRGLEDVWITGFNETNRQDNFFYSYEREWLRALKFRYGLKGVVLSTGVGHSNDWQAAKDAGLLDIIKDLGAWIELHAYASGIINLWDDTANAVKEGDFALANPPKHYWADRLTNTLGTNTWLAFRAWRDYLALKELGYGDLPIFIGEFGFDISGIETISVYSNFARQNRPDGWRDQTDSLLEMGLIASEGEAASYYRRELEFAEKRFSNYALLGGMNIVGLCIFCLSYQRGWNEFDISGEVIRLLGVSKANQPFPEPVPEEDDTAPVPVPTGCSIVARFAGGVNIRATPDANAAIIGTLTTQIPRPIAGAVHTPSNEYWFSLTGVGYVAMWVADLRGGCTWDALAKTEWGEIEEEPDPDCIPVSEVRSLLRSLTFDLENGQRWVNETIESMNEWLAAHPE